jgi:hypothetical protein
MAENMKKGRAQLAEADLTESFPNGVGGTDRKEMRVSNIFNQQASYEAIRKPAKQHRRCLRLYRDPDYAARSPYQALVAHPAWVASVYPHWVLQGLPGIHADHSASDWEFLRPIYVNDRITPKNYFVGFDVKSSKFAGKTAFEYQRFEYWNQRGELVSCGYNMLVRYERQTAISKSEKGEGKYDQIKVPHPWTAEEMEKVDQDVFAEEIKI